MDRSLFRYGIIALLAVALTLLSACSALRFGYNQATELAYWWLDGYADFNDSQAPRVRQALTQWHLWHRRTQLPDYVELLAKAQSEATGSISAERMCSWWNELRGRVDVSLERAIPSAAEMVLSLTPQQIQHIERRYAKTNEEFRDDYLQAEPAQRLKASVKRAIDRAESFYGRLDDSQRDRVANLVAQSPFDAELWISERRHRQQEALEVLRRLQAEAAGLDDAQAALRAYVERTARSPRAEYQRYSQNLTQYNCAFAASLHNSTTPAQRQTLVLKLKSWEADLRALVAASAP